MAAFTTPTQLPRGGDAPEGPARTAPGLLTGPEVEACKQRWSESIDDKYTVGAAQYLLLAAVCLESWTVRPTVGRVSHRVTDRPLVTPLDASWHASP